jgi:hypothetical protein
MCNGLLISILALVIRLLVFSIDIRDSIALSVERMTAAQYRNHQGSGLDRPILIIDALTSSACEQLCDEWIQAVGSKTIQVQHKHKKRQGSATTTTIYECTVSQCLDVLMQSTPQNSYFAFVEGLLDANESLASLRATLTDTRESLFPNKTNWFDLFPTNIKPSDCVVLAGTGATSTLHRDPFEWTGTSLCLEGRKLWRFLSPSDGWDARLESYRLASTAWDADTTEANELTLSAGWQSDLSLYEAVPSEQMPTARELADSCEADPETYLEELACTNRYLTPIEKIHARAGVDWCAVVQHPGELLIIPALWYHQTYAPEPSLAVASQRCGSSLDIARVVNHILSLQPQRKNDVLPMPLQKLLDVKNNGSADPQSSVALLFDYLRKLHTSKYSL